MVDQRRDEISLKDIIISLRQWVFYLKSKWIVILVMSFLGGILGFIYATAAKSKYIADLTFVLSSNQKNSGLAGLAGQFGIDLTTGNDDMFTGDNIIELFRSRKIIKGALFRTVPNKSQKLVDLFIDEAGIRKKWLENNRLKVFLPFPDDKTKLNSIQDSLINALQSLIIRKYLTIEKVDKKLSFYKVSTISTDERVATYLSKFIVEEASQFYIATKTKVAKQNLQMLQHEADSLRNLLRGAIVTTGQATDRTFNLNPAYQVQRSLVQNEQINITVLGTAYTEVIRNLELAKITLSKEIPLYQVIDEPELPLIEQKSGKLKWFIIGGILCGFLTAIHLLVQHIYKTIIS